MASSAVSATQLGLPPHIAATVPLWAARANANGFSVNMRCASSASICPAAKLAHRLITTSELSQIIRFILIATSSQPNVEPCRVISERSVILIFHCFKSLFPQSPSLRGLLRAKRGFALGSEIALLTCLSYRARNPTFNCGIHKLNHFETSFITIRRVTYSMFIKSCPNFVQIRFHTCSNALMCERCV